MRQIQHTYPRRKYCAICWKTNPETRPLNIAKLRGTDPLIYELAPSSFRMEWGIRSDLDAAQARLYIIVDCQAPFVNRKNFGKRKRSSVPERKFSDVRKVKTLGAISLVRVSSLGVVFYKAKPVKGAISLPVPVLRTFLVRLPEIENGG